MSLRTAPFNSNITTAVKREHFTFLCSNNCNNVLTKGYHPAKLPINRKCPSVRTKYLNVPIPKNLGMLCKIQIKTE